MPSVAPVSSDFLTEVALGRVPGFSVVHKFGRNSSIGSSFEPVTASGVYQTPTSAASLEVVSSSATDENPSAGAWVYG